MKSIEKYQHFLKQRRFQFGAVLVVILFSMSIVFAVKSGAEKPTGDDAAVEHDHGSHANMSVDPKLASKKKAAVYTCPMHPQIRQPGEGRCPICGMELVLTEPVETQTTDDESITISPVSRRVAGIKKMKVEARVLSKKIKAIGSISFDESRLATIPAYVGGRIEKLFADYTGVKVKKGDHLAVVYSPNLYAAQVEYLQSKKAVGQMAGSSIRSVVGTQRALLDNAKIKLSELGMSAAQIRRLGTSGKAKSRLEIYSPIGGTVIEKPAAQGQYLKPGQVIFKIADLSTVWLMVDVFPEDATHIRYGQKVEAVVQSAPDKVFSGRVAFIDPVVDAKTRTIGVRVEILNPESELRPGDYAEAEINVPITLKNRSAKVYDAALVGKYISPMHPQHISDKPGKCPICGMDMVPAEEFGFAAEEGEQEALLTVPRDAILRVGKHSVVFVEESEGKFSLRQVKTGPTLADLVVIVSGLEKNDTIAADGVFLIDSQMQLSGKTSLIDIAADGAVNKPGNKPAGHQHNH